MAVMTPLLTLMFVVTADFGRVFYTAITLAQAARAGAQYGAQSVTKTADTAGIQTAANQEAQNIGAISVSSSRLCKCPGGGTINCVTQYCAGSYGPAQVFVQVTASKTFNTLMSYPGIPGSVALSETAILRAQ